VVHRPLRIVADSRLRLPASSQLLRGEPGRTWLLCSRDAARRRRGVLEARGALVIPVRRRGRGLDLSRALALLAERGVSEVLVEGGGALAASLLREELVDEVHWFLAPRFIGGDGRPALAELSLARLADTPLLTDLRVRRLGVDLHLCGRVTRSGEPRA
jgi:diaminohydroxyphosphoribosylaminopyrimidine deaminase/5-amino-6-(5-phosphoribosylamino)uracil reductase